MQLPRGCPVLAALVLTLLVSGESPGRDAGPGGRQGAAATRRAALRPATTPPPGILFEENRGQTAPEVAWLVRGRGRTVFFTPEGLTWVLRDGRGRWVVKADFLNAARVVPEGRDPAPTVVSVFKGPRERWAAGCRTVREIAYRELWPGIDLVATALGTGLEFTWHVRPGADPSRIRFGFRGAESLGTDPAGRLVIATPRGNIVDAAPVAFQDRPIEAAWEVDGTTAGFALGAHDPARPLLIDPAVVMFSGYLGGDGTDEATGVAVDPSGNAYVAGHTDSSGTTFPSEVGPDTSPNGGPDVFVVKIDPVSSEILYAGYIGGVSTEFGGGIAVDASGNAYVVGRSFSDQSTFPVLGGPSLTHSGDGDTFVAKVNPDGTALVYSGFIGGAGYDQGYDIAVDDAGCAYVAGSTTSDEATFPVAVGPDLTYNGGTDAFVAKVKADGTGLDFAGYVGGSLWDYGNSIAVDRVAGIATIAGSTASEVAGGFPVLVGPDLTKSTGADAYVARVAADGAGLLYAGYIGGGGTDHGEGVTVDSAGNAYVVGTTSSSEASFPVSGGPDLTYAGSGDGFLAKVAANGTGFVYAGYIGGDGADTAICVTLDGGGHPWVGGYTSSSTGSFPAVDGPDSTANGSNDGFVARVRTNGTGLVACGFYGGQGDDTVLGVAGSVYGGAWIAGTTRLEDDQTGIPARGGLGDGYGGGASDGFAAWIDAPSVLNAELTKGSLKDQEKAGGDAFKATLVPVQFWWDIDTLASTVEIAFGNPDHLFEVTIPAGDPGWKAGKGKYSWKGPTAKLKVDTVKGTISIQAKKFDFPAPQENPIRLTFTAGFVTFTVVGDWTGDAKKPGAFRYP